MGVADLWAAELQHPLLFFENKWCPMQDFTESRIFQYRTKIHKL